MSRCEKKIERGDEEAKKQVVMALQPAIDMLKEEMKGKGPESAQAIEEKIADVKKVKGFWDNIKAGSCGPQDVY